jgi:hypothetical protein
MVNRAELQMVCVCVFHIYVDVQEVATENGDMILLDSIFLNFLKYQNEPANLSGKVLISQP